MKSIILSLIACVSYVCSYSQQSVVVKNSLAQEQIRLKNFAFCTCLTYCYPNDSAILKDGSAGGYFELSTSGNEVFWGIDSLAKAFSGKVYSSKENRPLGLMKCLDFYNSGELARCIRKYTLGKK